MGEFPPTFLKTAFTPVSAERSEESKAAIVASGVEVSPAFAASVKTLTLHVNVPDPAQVTFAGGAAAYAAFVVVNWNIPLWAAELRIVRVLGELFSGSRNSS